MSRDIAPFGVRMPTELKALVEEAAAANGRSINAEVVARLQGSLNSAGSDLSALSTGALLDELIVRLGDRIQVIVSRNAVET
jgi:hypothetical protein